MGRRVRGWRAMAWPDRGYMIAMMLLGLPLVAGAVRVFGYTATRGWLERHSSAAGQREPSPRDFDAAQRLAEVAGIAGRHGTITSTCLRQSLLVYWLLRRRGFAPKFRIGVRRQREVIDAHAWVELQGRALGQGELAHSPFT